MVYVFSPMFSIGVEVGFERVSYHVTETEGAVLQVCVVVMNAAPILCPTRTPYSVIIFTHDDSAGIHIKKTTMYGNLSFFVLLYISSHSL